MVHQMKEWSPLTTITDSIASSAVKTSWDLNSALIIALTESGQTTRLVAKYRPHVAILCVTPHLKIARQALISRGIIPLVVEKSNENSNDTQVKVAMDWAKDRSLVQNGEIVVIVAGIVEGIPGSTNMMRVEIVQ